jgi:hypothetical protein
MMLSLLMVVIVFSALALTAAAVMVVVLAVRAKGNAWTPPERSGPPTCVRALNSADAPLTSNAVWRGNELEVRADRPGSVRLFEVQLPDLEECVILYRVRIRTEAVKAPVYAELWCRIPSKGEFFSRGLDQKVSEARDWRTVEIPFYLEQGQRADLAKLNLVFEGPGVVRLSEIEVVSAPTKPRPQAA